MPFTHHPDVFSVLLASILVPFYNIRVEKKNTDSLFGVGKEVENRALTDSYGGISWSKQLIFFYLKMSSMLGVMSL